MPDADDRSYFAQPVSKSGPREEQIVDPPTNQEWAAMVEGPDSTSAICRCNRFMDHLLARFGETIAGDPADPKILSAKREFLSGIANLGATRGCGYDAASQPSLRRRHSPSAFASSWVLCTVIQSIRLS